MSLTDFLPCRHFEFSICCDLYSTEKSVTMAVHKRTVSL